MTTCSDARNPVEALAEEFLDRKRRGEHPTLREYVELHPDLADDIRDLFPALLMMEDLGEDSGSTTGSLAGENGAALGIRLERLGDYRILREIGRGGMGVVYEAEQESLGRRVALKVLSAGLPLDPKQVRRFEREAKAAARLHHTNIVPVFGVGRQDGHHYLVMQFIAGLGLDVVLDDLRRLRRGKSEASPAVEPVPAANRVAGLTGGDVARSLIAGRFDVNAPAPDGSVTEPLDDTAPAAENSPPADSGVSSAILPGSSELSASSDPDRQFYRSVARIGIQVAEALEYANRQGILHRDVKPSNLLLDNRGNVWVADFGLAKTAEADDLTHTGDIVGTIRYMAPERFSGHCDARSDVYGLGLTLYELVALRPAYAASDRNTLIDRVLHEEPERLKKHAPGVPRDLETIIAKAMTRDPAGRYATAAALADDLRRYVEDRPIRARRISPVERLARWCRRNPVVAGLTGLAALALAVVAVLSLLYAAQQTKLAEARTLYAHEQERRASEQSQAQGVAAGLAEKYRSQLAESNRRLATLNFERGQAAFEKGHVGEGMLWTVESLRTAALAGDEAGRHIALANLSAWRRQLVELKSVFSHRSTVMAVAFSPDGKTIATGGWDNTAQLWDAATGQPIGPRLEHWGEVFSLAFSPDGKTIMTGCKDRPNAARFWDAATGKPIGKPLSYPEAVWVVAFSPDRKTILTGDSDGARLWDAATRELAGKPMPHPGAVSSAAFSPDGKTILTGCTDDTARLWDAGTGQPIGPPIGQPLGPSVVAWGCSVAFSPHGKTILTGSRDKTARLWDAATRRPIGPPMTHSGAVYSVAFSPDGKTILTGCEDGTAQMWDSATAQRMGRPRHHQGAVWVVAFSPDGKTMLTGSADGTARLWGSEVDQPISRPLDHDVLLAGSAFSSDGKTLLTARADGRLRRWDATSGQLLERAVTLGHDIGAMALSSDGKTILTSGLDKTARLWDAGTGRPVGQPMTHSHLIWCVALSPDGKTVVTGRLAKTAQQWDTGTGRPIGQPMTHSGLVYAVAFSPDGTTVLTGSYDNTARLWDAGTGQPIGPPMTHRGYVLSVAFSPDGKTILTGSLDNTARLWDAGTGQPIGPPMTHSSGVWSVAFSPDGKAILSGSLDNAARLWDAGTGQPIGPPMTHRLIGDYGVTRVAFSPDGRFLLTRDAITTQIWNAPVPMPADAARLAAWAETVTGLTLDERGSIRIVDNATWLERRHRLDQFGGPPLVDPAPRLDPILFGDNPTARGNAWKERGQWDRAEEAYAEAIRARPLKASVWEALARLHVERGQLDRAAAAFAQAVRLVPDDLEIGRDLGRALLWSGDRAGWQRSNAALLGRFSGTTTPLTAPLIAGACSLGPEGTADPEVLVRLAEASVKGASEFTRPDCLKALGATLYRAGRFEDAIRRLEEGIQFQGGASLPKDWPFLAMAHHRLGHRDEARRWLDRLRNYEPSTDPDKFWDELEIRLLRSQAEAVVLYDPVFPAEPFGH
jgi:eukaryotic-like serine/threonine-protein kinase